jgi:hypothetical protein
MGELAMELNNERVDWLRARGIKRAVFHGGELLEVEFFDTIPAPPSFETEGDTLAPTEYKPESQCTALGCAEQGGWMGTRTCRAHGLAAAGVKS